MDLRLLVAIACAVLFYRIAAYERMSGWAWAVASGALSFSAILLSTGFVPVLLAQLGLFGVLWWYNVRRAKTRER